MDCIFIFILFFLRTSSARGGGGGRVRCQTFSFSFFPCSADHERDWPPCKVVFFRVGNQCAECEKQQQQQQIGKSGHDPCDHSRGLPVLTFSSSRFLSCLSWLEISVPGTKYVPLNFYSTADHARYLAIAYAIDDTKYAVVLCVVHLFKETQMLKEKSER